MPRTITAVRRKDGAAALPLPRARKAASRSDGRRRAARETGVVERAHFDVEWLVRQRLQRSSVGALPAQARFQEPLDVLGAGVDVELELEPSAMCVHDPAPVGDEIGEPQMNDVADGIRKPRSASYSSTTARGLPECSCRPGLRASARPRADRARAPRRPADIRPRPRRDATTARGCRCADP